MEKKIAHLVISDSPVMGEYGEVMRERILLTRYTDPIVDGVFTSRAWFSMFREVNSSAQELADEYNEVIYCKWEGKYYFPSEYFFDHKGGENGKEERNGTHK